jgi:hypothetical protein
VLSRRSPPHRDADPSTADQNALWLGKHLLNFGCDGRRSHPPVDSAGGQSPIDGPARRQNVVAQPYIHGADHQRALDLRDRYLAALERGYARWSYVIVHTALSPGFVAGADLIDGDLDPIWVRPVPLLGLPFWTLADSIRAARGSTAD